MDTARAPQGNEYLRCNSITPHLCHSKVRPISHVQLYRNGLQHGAQSWHSHGCRSSVIEISSRHRGESARIQMVFQCGMYGHPWLCTDCYGGMHISSLGNGIFCHSCKGLTGCDTSTGIVLGPLKTAQASLRVEHTLAIGDLLLEYLLCIATLSFALLGPNEGRLQGHTAVGKKRCNYKRCSKQDW